MAKKIKKTKKPSDKDFVKFLKDAFKNETNHPIKDLYLEIEALPDYEDTDNIFDMYDLYALNVSDELKRQDLMLVLVFYNRYFGESIDGIYHLKSFLRAKNKQVV